MVEELDDILAQGRRDEAIHFAPAVIEAARAKRAYGFEAGARADLVLALIDNDELAEADHQLDELSALIDAHKGERGWDVIEAFGQYCVGLLQMRSGERDVGFATYCRAADQLRNSASRNLPIRMARTLIAFYPQLDRLVSVVDPTRRAGRLFWLSVLVLVGVTPAVGIWRYGNATTWIAVLRQLHGTLFLYAYFGCIALIPILAAYFWFFVVRPLPGLRRLAVRMISPLYETQLLLAESCILFDFFEEAERLLQELKEPVRTVADQRLAEAVEYVKARLEVGQGRLHKAGQILASLVEKPLIDAKLNCAALLALCSVRFDEGRIEEAGVVLDQLDEHLQHAAFNPSEYGAFVQLYRGTLAGKRKDWEPACHFFGRGLELAQAAGGSSDLVSRLALAYGSALALCGRPADALVALRLAVESLDTMRSRFATEVARQLVGADYSDFARLVAIVLFERGSVWEAAQTVVRFKARSLIDVLQAPDGHYASIRPEKEIEELDRAVQRAVQAEMLGVLPCFGTVRNVLGEPVALVNALAGRKQKLQKLWLQGNVRLSDTQFVGVEEIQGSLLPTECVVDILWTQYGVVSFVVTPAGIESNAITFEDAQALFEAKSAGSTENRLALISNLTGELAKSVLACSRVFLVPDGPLTRLNLSLPLGLGPEIAVLPGAAQLPILRNRKPSTASTALLIGADPRHDLPGVPYEINRLRETLGSSKAKPAGVANDGDPLEILGRENELGVIHFACHGWIADSMEESGLLIERDGSAFLMATEDIERHVRTKASLVVLSACEVGQPTNKVESIDFLGLPRAFFVCCDARCIVTATTRVDDALSALVMSAFYRRLAEGTPVGRALREAEAEVANLTVSEIYVLAEAGLPVSLQTTRDADQRQPYRDALQQSPYIIYGDPLVTVELRGTE